MSWYVCQISEKLMVIGAGASAVPRVSEEQAAESQPAASEASSSPMDVDSPTPGFVHSLTASY